jgi:RNA polymerase sigma factor (sigma-70 family)
MSKDSLLSLLPRAAEEGTIFLGRPLTPGKVPLELAHQLPYSFSAPMREDAVGQAIGKAVEMEAAAEGTAILRPWGWLYRASSRNVRTLSKRDTSCLPHHRKSYHESRSPQDPCSTSEPDSLERLERLAEAMADLPPPCRNVLMLRRNGCSYREIAAHLGIPDYTAKYLVTRAIQMLREVLRPRD